MKFCYLQDARLDVNSPFLNETSKNPAKSISLLNEIYWVLKVWKTSECFLFNSLLILLSEGF